MFTKIFFSVIVIYAMVTTIIYWINDENWTIYSIKLRKTLYLIFLVGIGLGVIMGYVNYVKWSELVRLVIVAIVIDLTIFQTPNIMKFGNTEFEHNKLIEQALSESSKELNVIQQKQDILLNIIQNTEQTLNSKTKVTSFNEYVMELNEYLNKYIGYYDIKVHFYQFRKSQLDEDVSEDIINKIEVINTKYTLELSDKNVRKLSDGLLKGKMQQLSEEVFVLPILGKTYNALICVSGEYILPTDLAHIGYMAYFFEWHML